MQNMFKPSGCLHWNGPVDIASAGEGSVFRYAVAEIPRQDKKGILFEQKACRTPHLLPDIRTFREGECNVEEIALQLTRERGT